MIPAFRVYLFDVDGTLVDSAADIRGAIQGVLASTGHNDVSFEFLRSYIGRHLLKLFQDLFPDYSAEQIDRLIGEYRNTYPARNHACTLASLLIRGRQSKRMRILPGYLAVDSQPG